MLEEKTKYTIQDLFDNLDISILELGKQSKISEVTLARIRDGKPVRRATMNKLLNTLSEIYSRPLGMHNVTGANIQVNRRLKTREQK